MLVLAKVAKSTSTAIRGAQDIIVIRSPWRKPLIV